MTQQFGMARMVITFNQPCPDPDNKYKYNDRNLVTDYEPTMLGELLFQGLKENA